MMSRLRQLNRAANNHAGVLLMMGLAGVAWRNWQLWQHDRALATRLRKERKPVPGLSRMPKVSALVAAWNEGARIDDHVQSFLALHYPNIELILCAGGTDDTLQRARTYASEQVIVLEQRAGEGKQKALARCMEHASGEIIYLTDADCLFDEEALVRVLSPLIDEGEHAATGGSRPRADQMTRVLPLYRWIADVASSARQGPYIEGLLGRNAAVTRAAVDRIGGLDFIARTGTDYQLARRLVQANISIRYVGESLVPSAYPETLRVYRQKQSRWLRNLLLHGRRAGAWHDVRVTLRTVATGMAMLMGMLVAPRAGRAACALWALLVTYATVAKLRYAWFASRMYAQPLSARLAGAIPALTMIDFVVWALPVIDLLHPARREQW